MESYTDCSLFKFPSVKVRHGDTIQVTWLWSEDGIPLFRKVENLGAIEDQLPVPGLTGDRNDGTY